jgi:CelD/BcsL family acetyltransferase involved in cellulose biosynthesis
MAGPTVHAGVERVADVGPAMLTAWRALAADSMEPNPAMDPDLLVRAAETTLADAELHLATVEIDGRLEACLAFRLVHRWHRFVRVGLSARVDAEAVGVLPVLGAPLVRAEHAQPAVGALVAALADEAGRVGAGWLIIERLNHGGEIARLLEGSCRAARLAVHPYDFWERPVLRRRSAVDGWAAGLSPQRLRDNAKKGRRLARDAGGPVRVFDRGREASAVEAFLALEASGWKGAEGTALAQRPDQADLFRRSATTLGALGRSHLLSLEAAGSPVAMGWAVRSGTGLYFMRIAHDERFARSSPGGQLEVAMAEFFHQQTDAAFLDPCSEPSSAYHVHFLPDRQAVVSLLVGMGGWRDRALIRLLPAATRLRQRLLGDPGRLRAPPA